MAGSRKPVANKYARFLAKVNAQGFDPLKCWLWKGATKGNGYGHIKANRKWFSAHSYAYELFVGPIPDGLEVRHTCDNRFCVNPDHLFCGTRLENMQDCKAKGRTAGYHKKRLKESAVQEIRARLHSGHSPRMISESMKIGYHTVTAIRAGRSYNQEA